MNKADLIKKISEKAGVGKATADIVLGATLASIQEGLSNGESLTLIGFGTFSVAERASRMGRNPQTGKAIRIAAKNIVKFKPGKKLSDAVN